MSREQLTILRNQTPSVSANMAASRNYDEVEMHTFDEDFSHNVGEQELVKKKTHVLLASSLLQLPIWGRHFPPQRATDTQQVQALP